MPHLPTNLQLKICPQNALVPAPGHLPVQLQCVWEGLPPARAPEVAHGTGAQCGGAQGAVPRVWQELLADRYHETALEGRAQEEG